MSPQPHIRPVHSFKTTSRRAVVPVPTRPVARLLLLLQLLPQFLFTYFAIPASVFVDTYPFGRVKLKLFESEHETGEDIG